MNIFISILLRILTLLLFEYLCQYYPEVVRHLRLEKLKLMGWVTKFFSKKLLDHEKISSMVPWATKYFFENVEKPSSHPVAPSPPPPPLDEFSFEKAQLVGILW